MATQTDALSVTKFKFRLTDDQGRPRGKNLKGEVDPAKGLILGPDIVPFGAIGHMLPRHDDLLILSMGEGMAVLSTPGKAKRVFQALAPHVSRAHADGHRTDLERRGLGNQFRSTACSHCRSTLDLSRMVETEAVYCRYCDRVSQTGVEPKQTAPYRCCASCGYYARPRKFTEFYFYFLVYVYGWRYSQHEFCSACMRSKAWKMLAINLVFILGVPVALTQLWRAYFGGSVGSLYPGVEAANAKSIGGKRDKAEMIYLTILSKNPIGPGVHYNRGLNALRARDSDGAALAFEEALADCSNFLPAYLQLRDLYTKRGEQERVRELDELWDVSDAGREVATA